MKHKGFTLLESLVVLVVVSIFLLIPTFSIGSIQKYTDEALFFARFERYLSATQQAAIARQTQTRLMYYTTYFRFIGYAYNSGQIDLKIPESIQCKSPKSIVFSAKSGNYSDLRLIHFVLPEKQMEIKYQFQMGSGKYTKTIIE